MKSDHLTLTTQTKLTLDETQQAFFDAYAILFCRAKRRYTALQQRGELKGLSRKAIRHTVRADALAYRQFKGVESAVKGMIESRKSNAKNYIANINSKLKSRTKRLKKAKNRLTSPRPTDDVAQLSASVYQQQRGINILNDRMTTLKQGNPSFCFGGKPLLRERHTLHSDIEIADWQRRWHDARHDEFVLVGSSDESYGNQNCQLVPQVDDGFIAHLRVPPALEQQFGTHIQCPLSLRYCQDDVLATITHGNAPLSYRFKRKNGIWYVYITFRVQPVEKVTWRKQGALGVDVNADHLALTLITGDGNFKGKWTVPLPLRGKTTDQRNDIIGHAIKRCTDLSLYHGVPIIIESLDFTKKKAALDKAFPEQARMLSALAYGKIKQGFDSRCAKYGIELIKINPMYTSQLGELKYQGRYGLTRHHSAAMVIARRGLGFKESCPRVLFQFNNGSIRLHHSQDLMSGGRDKYGITVIEANKRAMKARTGFVLDTETLFSSLEENNVSVKRLSTMLYQHVQTCRGTAYHDWMTTLRIEQKSRDQV